MDELTTEIKELVLANRVYHPKESTKTITQVINNNQTIINYVANLDTIVKLNELSKYQKIDIMDYESKLEGCFEHNVERFKKDSFRGNFQYRPDHFFEMIHDITLSKQKGFEDLCVFYNKDEDRLYVSLGNGKWENYQRDPGVYFLVDSIVKFCLENYEMYLIRKLEDDDYSLADKVSLKDSLVEYYAFIATFNVLPVVQGKSDSQIMFNEDHEEYCDNINPNDIEGHRIVDKYSKLYHSTKTKLHDSDIRHMVKEVISVIKTTTKTNIKELNKRIMGILNVDEAFRKTILQ